MPDQSDTSIESLPIASGEAESSTQGLSTSASTSPPATTGQSTYSGITLCGSYRVSGQSFRDEFYASTYLPDGVWLCVSSDKPDLGTVFLRLIDILDDTVMYEASFANNSEYYNHPWVQFTPEYIVVHDKYSPEGARLYSYDLIEQGFLAPTELPSDIQKAIDDWGGQWVISPDQQMLAYTDIEGGKIALLDGTKPPVLVVAHPNPPGPEDDFFDEMHEVIGAPSFMLDGAVVSFYGYGYEWLTGVYISDLTGEKGRWYGDDMWGDIGEWNIFRLNDEWLIDRRTGGIVITSIRTGEVRELIDNGNWDDMDWNISENFLAFTQREEDGALSLILHEIDDNLTYDTDFSAHIENGYISLTEVDSVGRVLATVFDGNTWHLILILPFG